MCFYLGEVGAVALGRGMQILPAYSPAGRKPQEWNPQPLSPLTACLPPLPIDQTQSVGRGQAVQVMQSTRASFRAQGRVAEDGEWTGSRNEAAQHSRTIPSRSLMPESLVYRLVPSTKLLLREGMSPWRNKFLPHLELRDIGRSNETRYMKIVYEPLSGKYIEKIITLLWFFFHLWDQSPKGNQSFQKEPTGYTYPCGQSTCPWEPCWYELWTNWGISAERTHPLSRSSFWGENNFTTRALMFPLLRWK